MPSTIENYKKFIDDLVTRRPSVDVSWVLERGSWPKVPENRAINEFIAGLNQDQRKLLANMLQGAKDSGIFDTLAYMNDEMNLKGLRLTKDGMELPVEPFGYALYEDWHLRIGGDPWWPDSELQAQYREQEKTT